MSVLDRRLRPRRNHTYRLVFLANGEGVGKAVEIDRSHVTNAIEFALQDEFRRDVEIWEDGTFACLLQRDHVV